MVVLTQPVLAAGAQVFPQEAMNDSDEIIGSRRFSIGITEVSRDEFARFDPAFEFIIKDGETGDCPANRVWSVAAMKYCRWLSEREGISESEMCYPPMSQIDVEHLQWTDDILDRSSYRLPTEVEWEIACAAGTRSDWYHGDDPRLLDAFAWSASNSMGRLHPQAMKIPNAFGLFDTSGSIAEWCHPAPHSSTTYALRGGNYNLPVSNLKTKEKKYTTSNPYSFTGFRIARTASPLMKGDSRNEVP